ncbi:MAG: SDR family oxidoreductase [Paraglaciecola sp.]|uniref:SDR family NAD(P)-dependent oxidoreductase n=1 Tax=Pseudomonadati TaxID=3379134 RepID=UPI00273ECEC3|nr:SDR family oxidoreductase [Paraglaciecola sp.]MDP5029736.1 SDR family oxidoreductase [Paraglaciecola sp.]MDP5131646.1 SDR family oxidoreductase [Paraglaciecola sp.]
MTNHAIYPSLKDKVVFITGGASGIGAVMVEAFCRQQAKVIFIDILPDVAQKLCEKVTSSCNNPPEFALLDATDIDALQAFIANIPQRYKQLDILINNVANDMRHSPLEVTQQAWRDCLSVNLDATFFASQAAIKIMRGNHKGNIINISSINVLIGPRQMPGYVAAKSALNGLSKSLANQYGEYGIRVNSILPGWVTTDKQLSLWLSPEAEREWQKSVALKGRLESYHIANMALFLAADDSAMITGQQFVVDAGRT